MKTFIRNTIATPTLGLALLATGPAAAVDSTEER